MKNLILTLIVFGLVGYAAKISYDRFTYNDGNLFERTYSYPEKITVENTNGSKIQITLLARSSGYIEFEKSNGRKFVYPISSLSEKSQKLIMQYPETGIDDVSSYLSSGDVKLKDIHIVQLEDEIRRMEEEVERLNAKEGASQSMTEQRTIKRKIEALNKEISEIRYKISNR